MFVVDFVVFLGMDGRSGWMALRLSEAEVMTVSVSSFRLGSDSETLLREGNICVES
jgi:hypothetical protein